MANDQGQRLKIDPYPPQIAFFEAVNKYILYGGARGGGKSWAVRIKAHLLACRYSGIQILLLRRTFPELRENHINQLQSLTYGIAKYKSQDKVFAYPNGARIVCGYLNNEADVLQYQGQAYDVIIMDEATQFTEFQFQTLTESNRSSGQMTEAFNPRMYFTANPGGVGHAWVKRLFIDRNYRASEKAEDYLFIPSKVYDNKYLMENSPDYVRALENLPENRRKAMLDGDWDVFEGQYFPEFNRAIHVCEPFAIPSHWRIYRAFDYGLDMLACLIIAVDERYNAYVVEEINIPNLIISDAARTMLASQWSNKVFCSYAPPDMWNRRQETGKSAFDLFAENGLTPIKSNNARVVGWWAVKEYLKVYTNEFGEPTARLKIFSTCHKLIKHLTEIQADERNFDDCATQPHEITHNCDALRYFCVENKLPAELPRQREYDPMDDMPMDYDTEIQTFLEWGT